MDQLRPVEEEEVDNTGLSDSDSDSKEEGDLPLSDLSVGPALRLGQYFAPVLCGHLEYSGPSVQSLHFSFFLSDLHSLAMWPVNVQMKHS